MPVENQQDYALPEINLKQDGEAQSEIKNEEVAETVWEYPIKVKLYQGGSYITRVTYVKEIPSRLNGYEAAPGMDRREAQAEEDDSS